VRRKRFQVERGFEGMIPRRHGDEVFGEVDLFERLGLEVGQGEVEIVTGGGDGADGLKGRGCLGFSGSRMGVAFDGGEIAGCYLETAEQEQGTAGFELTDGDGIDDLRDGQLHGIAVLEGTEMDVVAAVLTPDPAIAPMAKLKPVMVVAERATGEGEGAALLAGGLDVAAERCWHENLL